MIIGGILYIMNDYSKIKEEIKKSLSEANPFYDNIEVVVENPLHIKVKFSCKDEDEAKTIAIKYGDRIESNTNICQSIIDKHYKHEGYHITVHSTIEFPNPDILKIKMGELFCKVKDYIYSVYENPKISLGCDYDKDSNFIKISLFYSEDLELDIESIKSICEAYQKDYKVEFYYKKVKYDE